MTSSGAERRGGDTPVPVRDPGVWGTFARPAGRGPFPGVVGFGGSGGGLSPAAAWAPMLASAGFAALAIAYFGVPGLPEALVEIEVETVERAIAWLHHRDDVRPDPVGVMGISRGSELALLAGALLEGTAAVVAFAPSGVSWSGLGPTGPVEAPAWTFGRQQVPYLGAAAMVAGLPEAAIRAAEIPVERTRGPILMVSGEADPAWPARVVERRAAERGFTHEIVHLRYPNAGHTGAGRAANAAARADSWPHVLDFLDQALGGAD